MRVSTAQFYMQSALQMGSKSSELNEQVGYLSSGKSVLTAKDDAIQYGTLAGYNNDLASIEIYQRNIIQAESQNNVQEIVYSDIEDLLNNIQEQLIKANNGAMTDEDLGAIAMETQSTLDQILDLANSQDENGNYIFSGYQTSQQPFSQSTDGSVSYNGDSGVRELQIAKNISIETNQSGDAVFMNIPNDIGDFIPTYPSTTPNESGMALASATVSDRSAYNTSATPHDYTFDFDATTADLTITNSAGTTTTFAVADYEGGQKITFDGIDVTLSGNPLPGESFTMGEQEEVSIFDTLNQAIAWMDQGSDNANTAQSQADYNAIFEQLGSTMSHITSRRVDSGIRLQVLDSQESRHLDTELSLATNISAIEDLDFTKAITDFEQMQLALQASQQAFSSVQGLSLFNYI
jgi:flagellar hook-associated protein 3 FlgL